MHGSFRRNEPSSAALSASTVLQYVENSGAASSFQYIDPLTANPGPKLSRVIGGNIEAEVVIAPPVNTSGVHYMVPAQAMYVVP